jgi:hypothetical protein
MEPIQVLALLVPFFTRKIGQKISRRVKSSDAYAFEIAARDYQAEVLAVDGNDVYLHVTTIDLAPALAHRAGSEQDLGDHVVSITGMTGLDQFWTSLLISADPTWATQIVSPKPQVDRRNNP